MIYNLSAGHNPDGKTACGAVGLIKESTEARRVVEEVARQLRGLGHTVNICTEDNGKSAKDVLDKAIAKHNANYVKNNGSISIQVHFNSGVNDPKGNGKTTGTESYIYDVSHSSTYKLAKNITDSISQLGFKNRGVKVNKSLKFLNSTKDEAILIECCFVGDADDCNLYDAKKMATAIVKGLTGTTYVEKTNSNLYRVQVGAFSSKANAEKLRAELIRLGYQAIIVQ